jgi:hypothetical protein
VVGVNLNVILPLFRDVFVAKDSFDRTGRLTGAAINAFVRIDIEMLDDVEIRFVLARVNAIHRANVNTRRILGADTRLGDYINSHYCISPSSAFGLKYSGE